MEIACLNCGLPYPKTGVPYCCPSCGGLFDYMFPPSLRGGAERRRSNPRAVEEIAHLHCTERSSVQVSQQTLTTPALAPGASVTESNPVSLGEGKTPLVWAEAFGRKVAFKCEYLNPTGSFKDRGSAELVAFLKSRGVTDAVEDSSGNAGASFAAYAARAGIRARVFVPESASGPKRRQIEAYGAELVPVAGPRSNASEAVKKAADAGAVYASHAYLPFNLPGYATIADEIVEQVGRVPSAVVFPAGQGGLLLGAWRGFLARNPHDVQKVTPRMIGVQAEVCSPLTKDESGKMKDEGYTLAEGVRVSNPLRRDAVQKAVKESSGEWIAVAEKDILPGRDALAQKGFYVEPTSAIVWKALKEILPKVADPVVVILTGSGLKYQGA
jgi:threonine synthase